MDRLNAEKVRVQAFGMAKTSLEKTRIEAWCGGEFYALDQLRDPPRSKEQSMAIMLAARIVQQNVGRRIASACQLSQTTLNSAEVWYNRRISSNKGTESISAGEGSSLTDATPPTLAASTTSGSPWSFLGQDTTLTPDSMEFTMGILPELSRG